MSVKQVAVDFLRDAELPDTFDGRVGSDQPPLCRRLLQQLVEEILWQTLH